MDLIMEGWRDFLKSSKEKKEKKKPSREEKMRAYLVKHGGVTDKEAKEWMSSQVDIEESFPGVLEEYTADEVRAIMSAGEKSKAQPPAPPEVPMCDPESEEIDIEILNAAIEALEGSDMADQLECFRSQLRRAFSDDYEDDSPRPDFGAPAQQGIVGFQEWVQRSELEDLPEPSGPGWKHNDPADSQFSNLRRLDPKEKQPLDPDKVGLDTLEMSPEEFARFRRRRKQ